MFYFLMLKDYSEKNKKTIKGLLIQQSFLVSIIYCMAEQIDINKTITDRQLTDNGFTNLYGLRQPLRV